MQQIGLQAYSFIRGGSPPESEDSVRMTLEGRLYRTGYHMFAERNGYTLVELVVVMAMISVVLAFVAPRLRNDALNDPLRSVARKMVGIIHNLRSEAVRQRQVHTLHLDLNSSKFWATRNSMTFDEQALAREQAPSFPDNVHIRDVWVKGEGKIVDKEVLLLFTPRGYTQMSAVHLRSGDDREMTLALSPFLHEVTVIDKYVEFD